MLSYGRSSNRWQNTLLTRRTTHGVDSESRYEALNLEIVYTPPSVKENSLLAIQACHPRYVALVRTPWPPCPPVWYVWVETEPLSAIGWFGSCIAWCCWEGKKMWRNKFWMRLFHSRSVESVVLFHFLPNFFKFEWSEEKQKTLEVHLPHVWGIQLKLCRMRSWVSRSSNWMLCSRLRSSSAATASEALGSPCTTGPDSKSLTGSMPSFILYRNVSRNWNLLDGQVVRQVNHENSNLLQEALEPHYIYKIGGEDWRWCRWSICHCHQVAIAT